MDALKVIRTRRRTVRFRSTTVPEAEWKDVVRAAASAPSAGRKRPWHFLILRNKKLLRELSTALHQAPSVSNAPLAVVVCADNVIQRHMGQWAVDCAAATEKLVLAAHAKGLGRLWVRIFPRKSRMAEAGQPLGLPDHITAFAAVFVGVAEDAFDRRVVAFDVKRLHVGHW